MSWMLNRVVFTCENCFEECHADAYTPRHIFPWRRRLPIHSTGECRRCGGGQWSLRVVYIQTEFDVVGTVIGVVSVLLTGFYFHRMVTEFRYTDLAHVPAETVAWLGAEPRLLLVRAGELAPLREPEPQRAPADGPPLTWVCEACGAAYLPHPDKPWSQRGYCSRVCAVERGGFLAAAELPASPGVSDRALLPARCPAGHRFEVPEFYRGTRRRCPACGRPTRV